MTITIQMLVTAFSLTHPETVEYLPDIGSDIFIDGIGLLPKQTSTCIPGYLYITDHLSKTQLQRLDTAIPVILFYSGARPQTDPGHLIIPIPSCDELAANFNQFQQTFHRFIDWKRKLDFAVFKNASFQEFIDICQDMIKEPLMIYDPALKLLAYSKNFEHLDDSMFRRAVKNGYLDMAAVQHFTSTHTFEELNQTETALRQPDTVRQHADNVHAININNELAIYSVLLYTNDRPKSYTTQLFQIFCDSLYQLLKKQHHTFLKNRSVTDYFLIDLLDNPDTPSTQIQERIQYHALDYEGNYLVLTLHSEIKKNFSEKFAIQYLRNNLINCRIFPYQQTIVILYHLPIGERTNYKTYVCQQFERLLKIFEKHQPKLYVSRPFSTIDHFSDAYKQTENTCHLSKNSDVSLLNFYDDYWIRDLLYQNAVIDKSFFYCEQALLDLLQENNKKSAQRMDLLYRYLIHERKSTEVAQELHMHRNNVIYHIRQLQEQFLDQYHLDLNDPDTRLKLLLSFKILSFTSESHNI